MLSCIDGINEVFMTTNDARLPEPAQPLKKAGLTRASFYSAYSQSSRLNYLTAL